MRPYVFAGGTAAVTGAASGIGEALAVQLAARGSSLVLVDRDKDRLGDVADRLRTAHPGLTLATYVADLSDDEQTAALARRWPPSTPRRACWSTTPASPSAAASTR